MIKNHFSDDKIEYLFSQLPILNSLFFTLEGGLGGSGAVDAVGKPYGSVTYPIEPGRK